MQYFAQLRHRQGSWAWGGGGGSFPFGFTSVAPLPLSSIIASTPFRIFPFTEENCELGDYIKTRFDIFFFEKRNGEEVCFWTWKLARKRSPRTTVCVTNLIFHAIKKGVRSGNFFFPENQKYKRTCQLVIVQASQRFEKEKLITEVLLHESAEDSLLITW